MTWKGREKKILWSARHEGLDMEITSEEIEGRAEGRVQAAARCIFDHQNYCSCRYPDFCAKSIKHKLNSQPAPSPKKDII